MRATPSCARTQRVVPSGRRGSVLLVVALAVPLAVLLTSERRIAGAAGFPLDDSWIHLQFARNIAEGAGFSYNPGVPVAGSTAPLWTLLLGAAFALFGPSIVIVKVIGVALTLAAGVVTRQAALAWGASAPAALAAAFAVLAPAVAFSLATVGTPVPAPAAAKIEGGLLGWLAGVHEPLSRLLVTRPWQFTREWIGWLWTTHVLLPIALAPAVIVVWRRVG